MFKIEILDSYGDVTEAYSFDTLEEILPEIKERIMDGTSQERIKLYKEIEFSITVDIEVKAD
jgi:hypothetical protein